MPRMSPTFSGPNPLAVLLTAFVAVLLAGCQTTPTVPANSPLVGNWRLDRSASDNPDVVVAKAVNQAESRFRRRLAKYGLGAPAQGSSDAPAEGPDYSLDTPGDRFGGPGLVGPDFRGLRQRLRYALLPPETLQIDVDDPVVSIGADELPPREYHVGEKLSRIDEYGTAIITPDFARQQFVLKSNYTSHAQRIDSYELDPASGALDLKEQITDPIAGRLIVHSVYRRE